MAEVHFIIKDLDDGDVSIELDFEPPIQKDDIGTPAQHMASEVFNYINKLLNGEQEFELKVNTKEIGDA